MNRGLIPGSRGAEALPTRRPPTGRWWRLVLLPLAAALAGCLDREAARSLGESGHAAASAGSAELAQLSDDLDAYLEAQYLLTGFHPELASGLDRDDGVARQVQAVQVQVQARKALLDALAGAYAAFTDLTTLNGAAGVQASMAEVLKQGDAYAALVRPDHGPLLDERERDLVGKAVGAIALAVQDDRIRHQNDALAVVLAKVVPLLQAEQATYASQARLRRSSETNVLLALWDAGLGRPDGVLKPYLGDLGLTYDSEQAKDLLTLPGRIADLEKDDKWLEGAGNRARLERARNLRAGVTAVITARAQRRERLHTAILARTIDLLAHLVEEHRNLTREKPVSIGLLRDQVAILRADYALLTATATGK